MDEDAAQSRAAHADLLLRLSNGQQIPVVKGMLTMASPVLSAALLCPEPKSHGGSKRARLGDEPGAGSSERNADSDAPAGGGWPSLPVEGSYEGWNALLDFLYHHAVHGEPSQLSHALAYHILPIAHTYNMRGPLQACIRAVQRAELSVGQLVPVSTTAGEEGTPDLLQWLTLADARQCTPLVNVCMEQLIKKGGQSVVRSALSSRRTRSRLEGLCSDTLMEILNVTARLPVGFKGIEVPCLTSKPPVFTYKAEYETYQHDVSCFVGDTLVLAERHSHDDKIHVLDTSTSDKPPLLLAGHEDSILVVAAREHGSGMLAVSGSEDCTARLWRLEPGCWPQVFRKHTRFIRAACFLDESRVATGGGDCIIRVWSAETGQEVTTLQQAQGDEAAICIEDLKASADGHLLLSVSYQTDLWLWDVRQTKPVRRLSGHSDGVTHVGLGTGDMAVSASNDRMLKVWDIGTGSCIRTMEDVGIQALCMDATCTAAVTYDADNPRVISVWDLNRGERIAAHTAAGCVVTLAANQDLSKVAVVAMLDDDVSGSIRGVDQVEVWAV